MTWFVVSMVGVVENLDGYQEQYPIDEDIVLYNANSENELQKKIQNSVEIYNSAGAEGVRYYERPAQLYHLGSRHINLLPLEPTDGTWVYHSAMKVKSWQEVLLLADGKAVEVQFLDTNDKEYY